MSEQDVRAILGEPTSIRTRSQEKTPSDAFASLGSMFRFEDDAAEIIWVFQDPHRLGFTQCVGFSRGKVCSVWQVAQSSRG